MKALMIIALITANAFCNGGLNDGKRPQKVEQVPTKGLLEIYSICLDLLSYDLTIEDLQEVAFCIEIENELNTRGIK